MLFNLQSAFVLAPSSSGFLTGSLERSVRIPKTFPFVNTFFQIFFVFLKVFLFVFISQVFLVVFRHIEYFSLIKKKEPLFAAPYIII